MGAERKDREEGVCPVNIAAVFSRLGVLKGLWHYLIVRAELRAALEKERERNRAFAAHREGLHGDSDTELIDYEDHEGRKLWVRKRGTSGPYPPVVILKLDSVQLPSVEDPGSAGEFRS